MKTKKHISLFEDYIANPKKCRYCKKDLPYEKRFNMYCNSSCASYHSNKINPRMKKTKKCKTCPTLIKADRIYCKHCFTKGKHLKDGYLKSRRLKDFKGTNAERYVRVRQNAKYVLKERVNACEKCGYNKHVEVCHRIPISNFSPNDLISEINKSENLILLCPNCHWEFDNDLLPIK